MMKYKKVLLVLFIVVALFVLALVMPADNFCNGAGCYP